MKSLFDVKKVPGSLDVMEAGDKFEGGHRQFVWVTLAVLNPIPWGFFFLLLVWGQIKAT